jgi:hypothetical protein
MYCAISSLFNSQTLFFVFILESISEFLYIKPNFFLLFFLLKTLDQPCSYVLLYLHRKLHPYCPSLLLKKIFSRQKADLWVTYSFCFFLVDITSHFLIRTFGPCYLVISYSRILSCLSFSIRFHLSSVSLFISSTSP